jgi:GNAT superfamily N-acetyltransferase
MWWRLPRAQFEKQKGAGNRRALKRLVSAGKAPGLLAYAGSEPVGWVALAPRADYPALDRSRVLARVDEKPVWSAPCFFIAKEFRGKGVSVQLLRAAAKFARQRGARILEGYPVVAKKGRMPDVFAWTGLPGTFECAGFDEILRRSPTRPIMRKRLA